MKKHQTKTTSRRAVLLFGTTALATGAAANVAAIVATKQAPSITSNTDLSHPEIGDEFTAIYERWRAQFVIDSARQDRYEARVTAMTGFARGEGPGYGEEGLDEYNQARDAATDPASTAPPTNMAGRSCGPKFTT
jgi:hypothetical protein